MNQKGFAPVIIILAVLLIGGIAGGAYYLGKLPVRFSNNSPRACTQEAKICPDGSAVGRSGPNCEFAQCPQVTPTKPADETASWKTYTNEKFSYSIKYPQLLSIRMRNNYLPEDLQAVDFFTEGNIPIDDAYAPGQALMSLSKSTMDYTKAKEDLKSDYKLSSIQETTLVLDKISLNKICGVIGVDKKATGWDSKGKYICGVFIPKQDKSIVAFYIQNKDLSIKMFDQIISTFKFLDQKNCGICPQFMPPAPDFCKNGTIVPGIKDACGCQGPPTCQL